MEASEMLDVIHYFFEEDYRFVSQEHAVISSRARKKLYKVLYDKKYAYGVEEDGESAEDSTGVKPYIEPTEFDPDSSSPFGQTLDQPLG